MDLFERDGGTTTADTVHRREEFRQIVADVQELPETQRTALLLREIDALSYDQIAEAMETTVPSVKSLLVRARVSLAEAAEARLLTCEEVRLELGQVAEGIAKSSAPVRRHLKSCERCRTFRSELRKTTKALAAVYPVGLVALTKKLGLAKLGFGGGAATGGAGGAATSGGFAAAGGAVGAAAGGAAGGALSAGIGTLASKTAAGMAAAAIVTAGAVEVKHATEERDAAPAAPAVIAAAPPSAAPAPAPKALAAGDRLTTRRARIEPAALSTPAVAEPPPAPAPEPTAEPEPAPVQEDGSTVTLPPRAGEPEPEPEPSEGMPYIPPSSPDAQPTPPPEEPAPPPEQSPPPQSPPPGEPAPGGVAPPLP
jgi:hypothetical protein